MKTPVLAFLALCLFAPAASAGCYEPTAPYCATRSGNFDDTSDFESCRRKMESYKSEVEDYLACMKRASNNVVEEYNSAVSSFNDRAR